MPEGILRRFPVKGSGAVQLLQYGLSKAIAAEARSDRWKADPVAISS